MADVFDPQTVSDKTIRRRSDAMQGFPCYWLMLPGNHDAASSESVWTRAQRLGVVPSNVVACLVPDVHVGSERFTVLALPPRPAAHLRFQREIEVLVSAEAQMVSFLEAATAEATRAGDAHEPAGSADWLNFPIEPMVHSDEDRMAR